MDLQRRPDRAGLSAGRRHSRRGQRPRRRGHARLRACPSTVELAEALAAPESRFWTVLREAATELELVEHEG